MARVTYRTARATRSKLDDLFDELERKAQAQDPRIELRESAADHLIPFCRYTFPLFQDAPHCDLIARELEAIEAGENDRLILELPPRHSKTELVSIRFPAWAMGRKPDRAFISASYSDKLATESGRRVRNIVDTQGVFPTVRLAADSKAKDLWHTSQGGQFLAVGIGSGVVGWGGDIICVDDPFKKREEAESEVMRDHVWNWYTSEILTRRHRDTAIVIVMHRWHEDDLVGRVLAEQRDRWRVVRLPALAEADDALGREPGEALWPWRFDAQELADIRLEVGERNWTSLYQQRPSPEEGAIFKWFPRYREQPEFSAIVVGLDTAYTGGPGADFTAWTAWGFDGTKAYAIEAHQFRGEAPEAERRIVTSVWHLQDRYRDIPVIVLHRARVAIDRVVAQHLRAPGLERPGLAVVEVNLPAGNTKEELGRIVSVEFESGRALVPEWAPWLEGWMAEHKGFPFAAHDDWVETTIIVLWYLFRAGPPPRRKIHRSSWLGVPQ